MAKDRVMTVEEVFEMLASYMNKEHVEFVKKAYDLAEDAHKEQFRSSGEPYILHPIQVAGILAELQMV